MKKNKKIIFIIAILSLLVISGCESGGLFGGGRGGKRPITDVDIRKGIDGLDMEFASNAPPVSVFEESPFPIAVELRNKGAFDIKATEIMYNDEDDNEVTDTIDGVIVFGFERAYADVKTAGEERQEFEIDGKSIINPDGDVDFKTVDAQTKKIGAQSETHSSTILATACYPYNTTFGSSVCVDPDIYGMRKEKKACDIKELNFGDGQGAPVAVTKIETRMLPEEDGSVVNPHFLIFIENMGNGEVIDLSKVEKACTNEPLDYTDFNSIRIKAELSGELLNCSVDDEGPGIATIRLRDKEDMVRCTLEEGIDLSRDAYMTPLRIELEYGYTFTISKSIIIEKALKY
jgi:hypothetical protein